MTIKYISLKMFFTEMYLLVRKCQIKISYSFPLIKFQHDVSDSDNDIMVQDLNPERSSSLHIFASLIVFSLHVFNHQFHIDSRTHLTEIKAKH